MNNTDNYLPQPRNWFEENLLYEGHARAEFEDPQGWIEGRAKVEFNILGEAKVEMQISDFHNPNITNGRLALEKLFTKHGEDEQYRVIFPMTNKNKCLSFKVETDEFIFISKSEIFYTSNFLNSETISFSFSHSELARKTSESPKYWVFPLLNFISSMGLYYYNLNAHPLRLYSFPEIPTEGFSDIEISVIKHNQSINNSMIQFNYKEKNGFIELVPDYEARKDLLENGKATYAITAIMNCEYEERNDNDISSKWIPLQYLNLLSLSTGSRVGIPWIELRSETGNLTKRLHIPQYTRKYTKGHVAIDDHVHRGIGILLTNSAKSSYFDESYIRDVIELLLLASENRSYSIADRFAYICRAIDTLCEQLGFRKDLSLKNHLPKEDYQLVKAILSDARKNIENFRNNSAIDDSAKMILERIQTNISRTKFDEGFGKYLSKMLDSFDLKDIKIVNKILSIENLSYQDRTGKSKKIRNFGDLLTLYRGATIHNVSYFHSDDKHWDMLYTLTRHLHDITLRIILKLLDYDGKYQPIIRNSPTDFCTTDWVTEETKWINLGYEIKD